MLAATFSISPAICMVVPMPGEPKLSSRGWALPQATSSWTVRNFEVAGTRKTKGLSLTRLISENFVFGSKPSDFCVNGLTTSWPGEASISV